MRILMAVVLVGATLLAGCGKEQVAVKLTVTVQGSDGKPVPGADVSVAGRPVGATDGQGRLAVEERRQPGEEVAVAVKAPAPASSAWNGSFVVRRRDGGQPDVVDLEARLDVARGKQRAVAKAAPAPSHEPQEAPEAEPGTASAPATAKASPATPPEDEARPAPNAAAKPVPDAQAKRAPKGAPVVEAEAPAGGKGRAGSRTIVVRALTDAYGTGNGVPGIQVYVADRLAGTTGRDGTVRVAVPAGRPVRVTLASNEHLPSRWSTEVGQGGRYPKELRRFVYPVTPPPIRVGLAGYTASTGAEPGVAEGIAQLDESLADHLFDRKAFVQVPKLKQKLDFVKLGLDDLTQRGWETTPLRSQLDLLVVGSVAGTATGPFTIETRVYTANGRLLLAHVKDVKDLKRPRDLTRELADEIVARFPFEGTVLEALDGGRLRINLGSSGGREIDPGTRFHLFAAEADGEGRMTGRREVGVGTVTRVESLAAELKPESGQPALAQGDRVVRALLDDPNVGATGVVALLVRAEGDNEPVAAANVYLDGAWVGATGHDGRVELPIRPRRRYELLVFKHGFQQSRESVSFPQAQGERAVALVPAAARFTVESAPSEAAVAVDGKEVGRTPITKPVEVRLGFRRVRVDAGGELRAFEKIIEFARSELALTGPDRVVLEKDWLRIGERLLAEGRAAEAMEALAQAGPKHPDYSAARHRLGQLYLDEKKDPEGAIREFERVLALPENRELIYKRFAVVYTNLGHAYYAQGTAVQRKDPEGAARAYAKALEFLSTARQNSRFFPAAAYDEALHDTYYYTALAQHRLADLNRSPQGFRRAELAWRDYLDFFPRRLEGNPAFEKAREGAEQFITEARRKAS